MGVPSPERGGGGISSYSLVSGIDLCMDRDNRYLLDSKYKIILSKLKIKLNGAEGQKKIKISKNEVKRL